MPANWLELIAKSGAVVVLASLFLWYIDRQECRNNKLMGNHLQHSTEALNNVSENLVKLTALIDRLIDKLNIK